MSRICSLMGSRLSWIRKIGMVVCGLCLLVYLSVNLGSFQKYLHEYDQGTMADEEVDSRQNSNEGGLRVAMADDPYTEQHTRNVERVKRVREVCKTLGNPHSTEDTQSRFLIVRPRKFAFCFVPKAGCTFWKRVVLTIQNNKTNIFELDKNQAHVMAVDSLLRIPNFDATFQYLSEATRVMFVRDPYSRLYSAYVDKYYLGDFWSSSGKKIIKLVRKNATISSLACGHDLTFEEFLRYALKVSSARSVVGFDEHWFPISKLCHPCTFNYHIIGKQETFSEDRDYVMDTVGLNSLLNLTASKELLTRDGIKQTIDMSWDKVAKCMSRKDSSRRMWTSYINQGYIHSSQRFPEELIDQNTTKDEFFKLAVEAYHQNPPSSVERRQQRQDAELNAYKTVSPAVLEQIQKVYRLDFDMFNYPVKPDRLFQH